MSIAALKRSLIPTLSPIHQLSQQKNSHFPIAASEKDKMPGYRVTEIIMDDYAHVQLLLSSQRLCSFFAL